MHSHALTHAHTHALTDPVVGLQWGLVTGSEGSIGVCVCGGEAFFCH